MVQRPRKSAVGCVDIVGGTQFWNCMAWIQNEHLVGFITSLESFIFWEMKYAVERNQSNGNILLQLQAGYLLFDNHAIIRNSPK